MFNINLYVFQKSAIYLVSCTFSNNIFNLEIKLTINTPINDPLKSIKTSLNYPLLPTINVW